MVRKERCVGCWNLYMAWRKHLSNGMISLIQLWHLLVSLLMRLTNVYTIAMVGAKELYCACMLMTYWYSEQTSKSLRRSNRFYLRTLRWKTLVWLMLSWTSSYWEIMRVGSHFCNPIMLRRCWVALDIRTAHHLKHHMILACWFESPKAWLKINWDTLKSLVHWCT